MYWLNSHITVNQTMIEINQYNIPGHFRQSIALEAFFFFFCATYWCTFKGPIIIWIGPGYSWDVIMIIPPPPEGLEKHVCMNQPFLSDSRSLHSSHYPVFFVFCGCLFLLLWMVLRSGTCALKVTCAQEGNTIVDHTGWVLGSINLNL